MTGHSTLSDLVPLYALDALDFAEATSVEGHLEECDTCRAELDNHRYVAAQLVPDGPAPADVWSRIEASIAAAGAPRVADLANARHRREPGRVTWVLAAAAVFAFVLSGILVAQRPTSSDPATDQGVIAAAESAADQPGSRIGEFLVDEVPVARVILTEEGLGYIIPTDALDGLGPDRTYQLWVLTPEEVAISAGVLGNDPAPATFTWKADLAGFALTREVAGGVVSSAGDVVSVVTDF